MTYYPVFLDLDEKRCVVVGGGMVALRKVNMLLDHDARVDVISPDLCAEMSRLDREGKIKALVREYEDGDLEGAFLVVAATNDSMINQRVAREANARGILVNVVDVPKLCSFIVPSYLRRGDITIAVSTSGKSPALARKIRSMLEKQFGEKYAQLVEVVEEVRLDLKGRGLTISGDAWQEALELDVLLELLKRGERDKARLTLTSALERAHHNPV